MQQRRTDANMPERRPVSKPTPASILNLVVFCTALGGMGLLAAFLPKPTYSELEKRDLAKMPQFTPQSYFSGKYTQELDAFYSDTFPFRLNLVSLGSALEQLRGFQVDDVKIHEVAPSSTPEVPASSTPEQPGGSSAPEQASSQPDEDAHAEQNGGVILYKDRAMSLFGGSQAMGKWYADVVNSFASTLPEVQVYDLVIPTAVEFYLPEKYQDTTAPQKPNIDYIYSQMDPKVKTVDAYSELEKHTEEYLYFRTDHHWTVTGAYYAYVAFCREAGFEPVPYEDFTWHRKEPFLGTLYAQTQYADLRNNPDYVDYPEISTPHQAYMYKRGQPFTPYASTIMADYASGANMYSVFLHGDQPLTEIQTEIKNGRKIVVVKESFGNAFAPFLANHFETVYVAVSYTHLPLK